MWSPRTGLMTSPLHPRRHNPSRLRWLIPGALLALASFACHASAQPSQEPSGSDGPVVRFVRNPDPAPDFKLADLAGKPLSLADARGKIVFLNFWATWCGPCRAEIPDLIELQSKYSGKLQIIGLAVDVDSPDEVKQFVQEAEINYPVAIAPDGVRAKYGGIAALPTLFVLDTQGRVVQKHVGLRDPALYEMEVRALLGLPVDAKVETFEDIGQVFLANASRATQLPGVDFSRLTAEQKSKALRRMNAESCNCGCTLTLAQCRINDSACEVSKSLAAKIIADFSPSKPAPQPARNSSGPRPAPNPPAAKQP